MADVPSTHPILRPDAKPPEAGGEVIITLRQHYVMAVMTGLLGNPLSQDQNWFAKHGVETAFKLADAMVDYESNEIEVEPV